MATSGAVPLPGPAAKSPDDVLAAFDSTPLFMKSLPDGATDDVALAALQELMYEGTPDEIAQNFKEQGNDYYKGKRYREALGFYTQGIDAKPEDEGLLDALLCNRAACNLELKNYGSVLRDCSRAISVNNKSSKAYYRSASALLALNRLDEAVDCCDRCLHFDKDNKTVQLLRERILKLKAEEERKEKERQEKLRQEQLNKARLQTAYNERNILPLRTPDNVSKNPYEPHFDPDDPTGSTLIIPVVFLYPQHATSDMISDFQEDTPFAAHLSAMFPPNAPHPEWDKNGEYVDGRLVVYGMTRGKRLLKIGKKMTLRDVCNSAKAKEGQPKDGLELKDGTLTFVVLPKGSVEERWVEEYKQTRGF